MLILFNKPDLVLSKFTDAQDRATLAGYIDIPHIYPAGRLDQDSEGLLLLTDDGALQHRLSDPRHKMPKVYWAQVEGVPDDASLAALRQGIMLDQRTTQPAQARLLPEPTLWPRTPPIRVRHHIPTRWIELIITEGRNRQVRRMTAAVGHPTLRLIRYAVGPWTLDGLQPGRWREAEKGSW